MVIGPFLVISSSIFPISFFIFAKGTAVFFAGEEGNAVKYNRLGGNNRHFGKNYFEDEIEMTDLHFSQEFHVLLPPLKPRATSPGAAFFFFFRVGWWTNLYDAPVRPHPGTATCPPLTRYDIFCDTPPPVSNLAQSCHKEHGHTVPKIWCQAA